MEMLINKKVVKELTHDEKKASEAAFQGLPPDSHWTASARYLYDELRIIMKKQHKQCIV